MQAAETARELMRGRHYANPRWTPGSAGIRFAGGFGAAPLSGFFFRLLLLGMMLVAGCLSPGDRARLVQSIESLREENGRLQRTVTQREATVASMHEQILHLQGFGPDRPVALFAPVRLEIVSRSGGDDYDDRPGDDGVTVYVRVRDIDGDVVKAAGSFSVQLLDDSDLSAPKLIGVYRFDDTETLRRAWYGMFGTGHFTLKCPFPDHFSAPRHVSVKVEFVDYLTGRTLTGVQEVDVSPAVVNAPGRAKQAERE